MTQPNGGYFQNFQAQQKFEISMHLGGKISLFLLKIYKPDVVCTIVLREKNKMLQCNKDR